MNVRALITALSASALVLVAAADTVNFDEIPRREFEIHIEALGVARSPERAIVELLYTTHIEAMEAIEEHWLLVLHWNGRAATEIPALHSAAYDPLDDPPWYDVFEASRADADAAARATQDLYFADLKALFPDRAAVVDSFERMRFRQRMLNPKGRIYFQHVPDIDRLVREVAPDQVSTEDVSEALTTYSERMDRPLKELLHARNASPWSELADAEEWDEMAERVADHWRRVAQVRDLNRRIAAIIERALPDDARIAFRERMLARSYPEPHGGSLYWELTQLADNRPVTATERARLEAIRAERSRAIDAALPRAREKFDGFFSGRYLDAYQEDLALAYAERRNSTIADANTAWREVLLVGDSVLQSHQEEIRSILAAVDQRPASSRADEESMQRWFTVHDPFWNPSLLPNEFATLLDDLGVDSDRAEMLREIHRDAMRDLLGERQRLNSLRIAASRSVADHAEGRSIMHTINRETEESWIAFRRRVERASNDEIAALLPAEIAGEFLDRANAANRERVLQLIDERMLPRKAFDLVTVIRELRIEPVRDAAFKEWRSMYHREIDRALERAEDSFPSGYERLMHAYTDSGSNSDAAWDAWSAIHAHGHALVAINNHHRPVLAELISDTDLARLDRALLEKRFPGVFIESPAERAFAILRTVATDADTREALADLERTYSEREAALRPRLIAGVEQWNEPAVQRKIAERVVELQAEGRPHGEAYLEHPAIPFFREQGRLVRQTCRAIASEFPGDAFDDLPGPVRIVLNWSRTIDN